MGHLTADLKRQVESTYTNLKKERRNFLISGDVVPKEKLVAKIIVPLFKETGVPPELQQLLFGGDGLDEFATETYDFLDALIEHRKEEAKLAKANQKEQEKLAKEEANKVILPEADYGLCRSDSIDFDEVRAYLDYHTDMIVLYNKKTNSVMDLSESAYLRHCNVFSKRSDNYGKLLKKTPFCLAQVNPYKKETIMRGEIDGQAIEIINTYIFPDYMKKMPTEDEISSLSCPEDITTFMNHLCMNENSKEAILDWMGRAVWNRCETVLCLNGEKEIGKSFLVSLFKGLVGDRYVNEAPQSMGRGMFNKILEFSRVLLYEELKISKYTSDAKPESTHEYFKRVTNEDIAIEAKGKDSRTIQNITSHIVLNNYLKTLQIDSDDRRFLVPELTGISPKTAGLDELLDRIRRDYITVETRDKEKVRQFGYWLKHCAIKEKFNNTVYKGSRFLLAVRVNLSPWQEFVVQKIEERRKPELIESKLRESFRKDDKYERCSFPTSLIQFQQLFDRCRDSETGERLAEVREEYIGDKLEIVVTPIEKYQPEKDDFVDVGV